MRTNIYSHIPRSTGEQEHFSALLNRPGVRIERIVSTGQSSPPGFWYDQNEGEWVIVLQGEAHLHLAGEASPRVMRAGDYLDLPPHCRHRVAWTTPEVPTVWLAVFYPA